jgi:hypothetical protein
MQENINFHLEIANDPETFQLARKIKQDISSAVLGQIPSLEKSAPTNRNHISQLSVESVDQRGTRQHLKYFSGQYEGYKRLTDMVSEEISTLINQRLKTFSTFTQSTARYLQKEDLAYLNEFTSEGNLVVENYIKWH